MNVVKNIILAAISLGSVLFAHAQIVTLNLNASNPLNTATVYGAGSGATAGWYNNSFGSLSGSNLLDTTNTATTVDWFFTANGLATKDGGTASVDGSFEHGTVATNGIFAGDVYSQGHTIEINFTDIPFATYDIYVYADNIDSGAHAISAYSGNVQQGSTLWLSTPSFPSTTYAQGTSTNQGSPTNPANYVVFSGLTGSSVTIDLSSTSQFALLNGIEIVSSVPEPTSVLLLVGGMTWLLLGRQRRCIA